MLEFLRTENNDMTKEERRNQRLARDIYDFFKTKVGTDIRIYFNNKCITIDSKGEVGLLEDIKSTTYFEYGNDETVSMSFEGYFKDAMNYGEDAKLIEKFNRIFEKHKCYYELGYAWTLSVYFDEE